MAAKKKSRKTATKKKSGAKRKPNAAFMKAMQLALYGTLSLSGHGAGCTLRSAATTRAGDAGSVGTLR